MAETTQSLDLNTTIAALKQGITTVPLEEGIALLEAWQRQLEGHDIAEDLGELKAALQNGNRGEASQILIDLGEDTFGIANQASDSLSAKIQELGQLLYQAGNSLK